MGEFKLFMALIASVAMITILFNLKILLTPYESLKYVLEARKFGERANIMGKMWAKTNTYIKFENEETDKISDRGYDPLLHPVGLQESKTSTDTTRKYVEIENKQQDGNYGSSSPDKEEINKARLDRKTGNVQTGDFTQPIKQPQSEVTQTEEVSGPKSSLEQRLLDQKATPESGLRKHFPRVTDGLRQPATGSHKELSTREETTVSARNEIVMKNSVLERQNQTNLNEITSKHLNKNTASDYKGNTVKVNDVNITSNESRTQTSKTLDNKTHDGGIAEEKMLNLGTTSHEGFQKQLPKGLDEQEEYVANIKQILRNKSSTEINLQSNETVSETVLENGPASNQNRETKTSTYTNVTKIQSETGTRPSGLRENVASSQEELDLTQEKTILKQNQTLIGESSSKTSLISNGSNVQEVIKENITDFRHIKNDINASESNAKMNLNILIHNQGKILISNSSVTVQTDESSLTKEKIPTNPIKINSSSTRKESSSSKQKLILLYTALFGRVPWPHVPYHYNFTDLDGSACTVNSCKVTYDKTKLSESDLVIFHGRDLPNVDELRKLSSKRTKNQAWIFFMHESPLYSYFNETEYNGIFNWTATYRVDSDIMVPYHYHGELRPYDSRPVEGTNFTQGKEKLITFVNSNCGEFKIKFISKLKEYIPLDVYGACAWSFDRNLPACPRKSQQCVDIQKKYKFYLALENGFCKDYVTEKYWLNALEMGLVPVVVGAANYSNSKIAIPGSFIDAADFNTMKDLADHLIYLDKNDTAYAKYHEWRYKFRLFPRNTMCLFCYAVHRTNVASKSVNLDEFWGIKSSCNVEMTEMKDFLKRNGTRSSGT